MGGWKHTSDSEWRQGNDSEWGRGLHTEFLLSRESGLQLLLREFTGPSGTHTRMGERALQCFHETLEQSLDTGQRAVIRSL